MKNSFLFPHRFKLLGWILFVPSSILGITFTLTGQISTLFSSRSFQVLLPADSESINFFARHFENTVLGALFIIGALLVAFSKEKVEDEFIASLRLTSFQWAVFINYLLLLLCFLFVYGINFINVMTYTMFTVIVLFIIRFNYMLYVNQKSLSDEK